MWHGHTVSVILPTYNERDSIRECIERFFASGCVDEVIVVNNNAVQGTSEEVARTQAREVHEPVQGYGQAIQRGLREAVGEWLVICEPDGTFRPEDIFKLLAYAQDFDYVIGTRTTREMVWRGANMGFLLKWGNWAVAKLAEFLFNCTILTDVGCTYRLLKRGPLQRIAPRFTRRGNDFGLEMTLLVISQGISFVEIPVNYLARVGASSVTGSMAKAIALGFSMTRLILRCRLFGPPAARGA
jgi:glycosyltransferase involved in cell wall biosynthesis